MAVCKQCGVNNPDENKYCFKCGALVSSVDAVAIKSALDRVEREFEEESKVGLDKSRLTFICDVCGKVNPIDVPGHRCSRCGKKMPRGTYIKALKSIAASGRLSEMPEAIVAPPQPVQPAPQQVVQQPVQQDYQELAPQQAQQIYRMSNKPQPPQQNGQIVQPFVIVPYVSQTQPVYQYQPNTVYRYSEYTEEEKRRNQETLARIQREREEAEYQRVMEEERLNRIQMQAREREYKRNAKLAKRNKFKAPPQGGYYGLEKSNVRITSFFALLFALIAIMAVFFIDVLVPNMTIAEVKISFGMYPALAGETSIFYTMKGLVTGGGFPGGLGEMMAAIGMIAFGVILVASALQSLVRLFTGRSRVKGVLLPIFALLATIVAYVGYALGDGQFDINRFVALFPDYIYCAVVMVAVPLVLILLAVLTRKSEDLY